MIHRNKIYRLFVFSLLLAVQSQGATPSSITPIALVKIDQDGDFLPDLMGDTVLVAGRASVNAGTLDTTRLRVFIQDRTGGILLSGFDQETPIQLGDSIVVTGILNTFNGVTGINVLDYVVIPCQKYIPDFIDLQNVAQPIQWEQYEGMLVRLKGTIRDFGRSMSGDQFFKIVLSKNPKSGIDVFIYHNRRPFLDIGDFSIGDVVTVTGIVGQYDTIEPFDANYELYPRYDFDLRIVGKSSALYAKIFVIVLIAFFIVIVWTLVLRWRLKIQTKNLREREKALAESEAMYRTLFDNSTVGIGITDQQGNLIAYNDALLKPGGYTQSDMEAMSNITDLYYDSEEPQKVLDMAKEEGRVDRYEVQFKRKDGTPYDTYLTLRPVVVKGQLCWQAIVEDITEQKKATEALNRLKEFHESIVTNMAEGVFVMDEKGTIIYNNPAAEKMLGYGPGELKGHHWSKITPKELHHLVYDVDEKRKEGITDTYEFELVCKNGERINVLVSGSPRFKGSQFIGTLAVCTDITERKFAEEDLKTWKNRYEKVITATGEIIYEWDILNSKTSWGGSVESVLGYTPEELSALENGWEVSVHPEDRDRVKSRYFRSLMGNESKVELEYRFLRKDGTYIQVLDRSLIIRDEHGKAIRTHGVLTDITKQKKAEKEAEELNRLRTVLYRIADATSRTDNLEEFFKAVHSYLSTVVDTSNFFIAIYDREKETMSFPYYIDEKDTAPGPIKVRKTLSSHVIHTGKPLFVTQDTIREMGENGVIDVIGTIPKVWLGVPLKVTEGLRGEEQVIGVIVVQSYTDPTLYSDRELKILQFVSDQIGMAIHHLQIEEKIRKSEAKYRQISEQLTESNNLKALLLDIITHDLKNPAGTISGMSDLMLSEDPENEMVRVIKESSDSLLQVIENATTMAKITLKEEIAMKLLDLTAMMEQIVQEYRSLAANLGMTIENRLTDQLIVYANPIIAEVFKNYLSNAIKYAASGKKVIIDARLSNDDQNNSGKFVIVSVSDFGTPIKEKYYRLIFERRIQLNDGQKHGRGLGLAIVKRIADAHNGEVWIAANRDPKTNKKIGNTFYFKIPAGVESSDSTTTNNSQD